MFSSLFLPETTSQASPAADSAAITAHSGRLSPVSGATARGTSSSGSSATGASSGVAEVGISGNFVVGVLESGIITGELLSLSSSSSSPPEGGVGGVGGAGGVTGPFTSRHWLLSSSELPFHSSLTELRWSIQL